MSDEIDDAELNRLFKLLRKQQGFSPMTAAEADAAYDAATAIPMTDEEIKRIVDGVCGGES